ncbi:FAD-dependent monooxygenase [Streptomyces sp. NBC_01474]|uniref:FAD-dependent oxidoreductase n=1 Tax=Streptomyces sp. NBC_01474 TaxID=2903880 RepID=UPI002DDC834D|nr:FAD-dependent monooxygenase [Streptomyces sp. NBC_01474]WSD94897.1 FAD-dependent monooxygenase [Streptomyces sp. NBC_01474]
MTLVGDAAHLMSPFAGEGANLALIDGADLAREIDVETALSRYEKMMFARGAKSAAASQRGLDMMFVKGPPRKLILFFKAMGVAAKVAKPFARIPASGKGE